MNAEHNIDSLNLWGVHHSSALASYCSCILHVYLEILLEGNICFGSSCSCAFHLIDGLHTPPLSFNCVPNSQVLCFLGIVDDHRFSALMRYVHLSLPERHNMISMYSPNASTAYRLNSVKTILCKNIGVRCSNQTQLAQGHHINVDLALVLKILAFGFTASRSYNCAQDGLDTVQPALVVLLPSTSANTPLTVMVVITHCNLRWWCVFFGAQ